MATLAERIQQLGDKAVDATKGLATRIGNGVDATRPLAERVRTLAVDTIKEIPKATSDLAVESARQTGKGLGILWDSLSMPEQEAEYIGIPDKKKQMTRAEKIPQIDPTGMMGSLEKAGTAGVKAAPKVFEGFTDLSTKLLEKLKGRSTVSKQFISDATNAPELKQTEKDIIRRVLGGEGDQVDVPTFAEKVKAELLPLERVSPGKHNTKDPSTGAYRSSNSRWEHINLPEELRGPVANYSEHIYESPVKTSAGTHHYDGDTQNYFGHTRVEDLPDNGTRRVIEVQSDLFQKGRLENETESAFKNMDADEIAEMKKHDPENYKQYEESLKRNAEVAKLDPYKNNASHFRMIREEVKQAALDGKTKLQFPTGETAMKIEGLGSTNTFTWKDATLRPEMLKPGMTVNQGANIGNEWIITDVLGDGKFKAVPKDFWEELTPAQRVSKNSWDLNGYEEGFDISGKVDTENPIYQFYSDSKKDSLGRYLKNKYGAEVITDAQGVRWWQMNVKPEQAKMPVEAFGKANAGFLVAAGAATVVGADMASRTVGIPSDWSKNLAEGVKNDFPWDEQALKDIEQLDYRQVKWSGNVRGTYSSRGAEVYDLARKVVGEKLADKLAQSKLGQKIDSPTIKIDKDLKQPVAEIMAHEMLHRVFDQRFEDEQETEAFAKDFYETWNGLMRDESFDEKEFQKLEDVDRHITGEDVYADIPPFDTANERFAYLGTLAMYGGMEAIPEPLRRFYSGVIKDYSVNEDGTPTAKLGKSRKTKEF